MPSNTTSPRDRWAQRKLDRSGWALPLLLPWRPADANHLRSATHGVVGNATDECLPPSMTERQRSGERGACFATNAFAVNEADAVVSDDCSPLQAATATPRRPFVLTAGFTNAGASWPAPVAESSLPLRVNHHPKRKPGHRGCLGDIAEASTERRGLLL